MVSVQQFYSVCLSLQYLSCLSTSSSNDKLAFDVGLKEKAQGNDGICTKILMILCTVKYLSDNESEIKVVSSTTFFEDVYFFTCFAVTTVYLYKLYWCLFDIF